MLWCLVIHALVPLTESRARENSCLCPFEFRTGIGRGIWACGEHPLQHRGLSEIELAKLLRLQGDGAGKVVAVSVSSMADEHALAFNGKKSI